MNREDIIRMAREAGFVDYELDDYTPSGYDIRYERFAALVAAAEREACAYIAARILKMPENDVSRAIRARGEPK